MAGADAYGHREHVAHGMNLQAALVEPERASDFLHPCLIFRNGAEASAFENIGAAVAHAGYGDFVVLRFERGHQRRPHTFIARIARGFHEGRAGWLLPRRPGARRHRDGSNGRGFRLRFRRREGKRVRRRAHRPCRPPADYRPSSGTISEGILVIRTNTARICKRAGFKHAENASTIEQRFASDASLGRVVPRALHWALGAPERSRSRRLPRSAGARGYSVFFRMAVLRSPARCGRPLMGATQDARSFHKKHRLQAQYRSGFRDWWIVRRWTQSGRRCGEYSRWRAGVSRKDSAGVCPGMESGITRAFVRSRKKGRETAADEAQRSAARRCFFRHGQCSGI